MQLRLMRVLVAAAVPLVAGGAMLATAGPAAATATITVSPTTNLSNGTVVNVSGSGFAPNSLGAILECNSTPGQPTVTVLGAKIPVSCPSPLLSLHSTSATGTLAASTYTIKQGTTGPPGPGNDSNGNPGSVDAALYPCPPTPAQQAAGQTCVVAFGDQAGDQAVAQILFVGEGPPPTTTTLPGQTTTTTAKPITTTTTAKPATTTTSAVVLGTTVTTAPRTLPLTGATRSLAGLAAVGLGLLIIGYAMVSKGRSTRTSRR